MAREARTSWLWGSSSPTARRFTSLATDPRDSPEEFDRMDAAGCACLLGAWFAPVMISANTDSPAPYPDIESQTAREREHLDVWEI